MVAYTYQIRKLSSNRLDLIKELISLEEVDKNKQQSLLFAIIQYHNILDQHHLQCTCKSQVGIEIDVLMCTKSRKLKVWTMLTLTGFLVYFIDV